MKDLAKNLDFQPLFGCFSKHTQTVLPTFLFAGTPPPSDPWILRLSDGDSLSCHVSTPKEREGTHSTIFLVHGLGGSYESSYMIRISRKLYLKGYKVIRVNLRGCGSGIGLAKKSHYAGNSPDVLELLKAYQEKEPNSPLTLIGFSLGGNIALKLCGELEEKMSGILKNCIAVCPPLDLFQAALAIEKIPFYNNHYLKTFNKQFSKKFESLYDLDNQITAPTWGYKNALEYYRDCSSLRFLSKIRHDTHILLAEDDPFIDPTKLKNTPLHPQVNVYKTKFGGHMGYIGKKGSYWLDSLLLDWVEEKFSSSLTQSS